MIYLLTASLIWAFSFGLIKGELTGLDPVFVSFVRLLISFVVFLPLFRMKNLKYKDAALLSFIGAIQYGLMYVTYIFSYKYLKAYEVALFTVFTPIYVTLINDLIKHKLNTKALLSAFLAATGTGIIVYKSIGTEGLILGFLLMQISNLCFAIGQVLYKHFMKKRNTLKDRNVFALMFLGAVFFTLATSLFTTNYGEIEITKNQILILIYLGAIASGLGFFLWNYGAVLTKIGTLAVFNNLKIPLAVTVSLVIFGERTNPVNLLVGGSILLFALFYISKIEKSYEIKEKPDVLHN